ncbi:MAG: AAA family ATPase [Lachnospiraceae bacterium]|nr:AAA family ATPase [Lachnospiraceae bacterium]
MVYQPLPVGVDNFEKLINKGYYYVDKTLMIKDLLDRKGELNLFTRPRRFGKTLNLSMLKYYFEDTGNAEQNKKNAGLFSGLSIMDAGETYTKEMGQYPVIMLTLKSAKQNDFEMAFACLKEAIVWEFQRHAEAVRGKLKRVEDAEKYEAICGRRAEDSNFFDSLAFLSSCLSQAYGKNCVILIDEYDVPLENSYFRGFYDQMVVFIRSLFESALKTNPYLEFAVITGCLRVSRESIFTGLNNLEVISIMRNDYGEYFGFVQQEVDAMLEIYGMEGKHDIVKQWYDGYCFGNTEVYNPWSIICFVKEHILDRDALMVPYWANTSANSIVKSLVERIDAGDETMQGQLEHLMNGGSIEKTIHEDITYDSIYDSEDNLWNFLFFTGYMKKISMRQEGVNRFVTMAIPNMEVSYIYENTISVWFDKKRKSFQMSPLYTAIEEGDTDTMEQEICGFLEETISYFDYGESYYHGFLAGLLGQNRKYRVMSNREAGLGRADIILKTPRIRKGRAIVLELKAVKSFHSMEEGCKAAILQIREKKYKEELQLEGYEDVTAYGICFFRKECVVMADEEFPEMHGL